jgi:hypothetical protein
MDAAVAPAAEPAVKRSPLKARVLTRTLSIDGERITIMTARPGRRISRVLQAHWNPATGQHQIAVETVEALGTEPAAVDTSTLPTCCWVHPR